jgi:hypothetical protein
VQVHVYLLLSASLSRANGFVPFDKVGVGVAKTPAAILAGMAWRIEAP